MSARTWSPAAASFLAALLAGCASPPRTPAPAPSAPVVKPDAAIQVDAATPGLPPADASAPGGAGRYGPEILAPGAAAVSTVDDDIVARVGDRAIRKADVYDRMLENDQRAARLWVDLLILDHVVADFVRQFGIRLSDQEVAALADGEEGLLRTRIEVEYDGNRSFDDYLGAEFGLDLDAYRRLLSLDLARIRYRGMVFRYLALREERAEIRMIVHADRTVLEDARQKAVAGADFAALARQLSEDRTRTDGGRLGPFGRAFRHPIALVAFELEAGQTSEVLTFDDRGTPRHALVYCLRRIPARDESFDALRAEIVADLEARPVTPFEQSAFIARYCRPASELDSVSDGR